MFLFHSIVHYASQGDLEELLGAVPEYDPTGTTNDSDAFPALSTEDGHPYHLIIVYVVSRLVVNTCH